MQYISGCLLSDTIVRLGEWALVRSELGVKHLDMLRMDSSEDEMEIR